MPLRSFKQSSTAFSKGRRLRKAQQYNDVFCLQQKQISRYWIAFIRYNGNRRGGARLGLAISKKVSNLAVQRNRLKRLCRECFRMQRAYLPTVDIVIVAKKHAVVEDNIVLSYDLEQLFKEALIKSGK